MYVIYIYDTICNTCDIISTLYDFTPLKLSHYIQCTHAITHPTYDVTHMAMRTLYLPSVPLYLTLHPLYLCHQTQGISYTTPTLCMTSQTIHVISYSVCILSMTSQPLHGRYYMKYICDIISPMFLTKYPLSMTSQHSVLMYSSDTNVLSSRGTQGSGNFQPNAIS